MRRAQSMAALRKQAHAAGGRHGSPLVSSASAVVLVVVVGATLWTPLLAVIGRYWEHVAQPRVDDTAAVRALLHPGLARLAALLVLIALSTWLIHGITTQHWWGRRDRSQLARLGLGAPLRGQRSAEHLVHHGVAIAIFGIVSGWLIYATPRLAPHSSTTTQTWLLALAAVANTIVWIITAAASVDLLQRYAWHRAQLQAAADRPSHDAPRSGLRRPRLAASIAPPATSGANQQRLFLYGPRSYAEFAWQPSAEVAPRLLRCATGLQPSQLQALLTNAKRAGMRTRCAPRLTQAFVDKPRDTSTWQALAPVWAQTFP